MPQSILSSILSKPQFVATNESSNSVLWPQLGILDVEISNDSENSDKPISNQQLSDKATYQSILTQDIQAAKIIQPSRLRVTALCADISTLENVLATYSNLSATISINSKSIITQSLMLTAVDVEQTPEMISASRVVMVFEQAQPPANSGFAPEQAADASVYGVSIQTPPTVVPLATLTQAVKSASFVPTITVSGALIDADGGPFILDSSRLS
jgi:hypothetical protein